jgi:hypothetical protein
MPYADPDRQRAAKAEHARRKRATHVEPRHGTLRPLLDEPTRLRTAEEVLVVIEGQVAALVEDEELGTAERARTVATLAGVALRAVEAANLAARIEAIEAVLGRKVAA